MHDCMADGGRTVHAVRGGGEAVLLPALRSHKSLLTVNAVPLRRQVPNLTQNHSTSHRAEPLLNWCTVFLGCLPRELP